MEDTATGALIRNVDGTSGDLAATTTRTGDTVLQLTTIHGDVALQLPLDTGKEPVALDNDEYGNPRTSQEPTRCNWLGAKQRSAETPSGVTLMGVRLYNPQAGRFLSTDPVYGGGDNAYSYPADPINNFDLDGRKVLAKYNKDSRSCSFWQRKCVILDSRPSRRTADTVRGFDFEVVLTTMPLAAECLCVQAPTISEAGNSCA